MAAPRAIASTNGSTDGQDRHPAEQDPTAGLRRRQHLLERTEQTSGLPTMQRNSRARAFSRIASKRPVREPAGRCRPSAHQLREMYLAFDNTAMLLLRSHRFLQFKVYHVQSSVNWTLATMPNSPRLPDMFCRPHARQACLSWRLGLRDRRQRFPEFHEEQSTDPRTTLDSCCEIAFRPRRQWRP